nr:hypothetical protein [Tanacetum cinerariifolium]
PADSDTSSDSEPEVEAEDEDGDEATVSTITQASYSVPPFLGTIYMGSGSSRKMFDRANTEYSTLKRLGEMHRYLSGISTERRSEAREHYKLKQSVSTLEDQMRGLMLEDKEEKERLKKKLSVSQQEKEQIEQAFRHRVNSALEAKRAGRVNERGEGSNANEIGGQDRRFHELILLCPEAIPTEKKKVEAYIKGLPENIKGETTSSRPVKMNEVVRMAHTLMEQKIQAKAERVSEGNKRKWENSQGGNRNNNPRGNYQGNNRHQQYNNQRQGNARALTNAPAEQKNPQGEEAHGRAYVIKEADKDQGPNVVMGTFLLNNRYATVLFDSGSDKSFVNTSFIHLIDIDPIRLNTSYKVELADGRVASTNIVLKGCTINLVGHLFKIDLMPIELGTFDVIIGMDWLVEQDAVIVCGKKVVHVPYKNKTLVVKGDREDVPVIRDFPEVFPDDLSGLPPPQQVEFRIDLVPGVAPDKEEHEKHLKSILELLKREQLYVKFLKCDFWLESVQFLGHVIDSKGVHIDPAKIAAIKNWATPTTPTEKNKKFEWETEAEEAFQTLKQKLCFRAVLMQQEKVIAYASRQLRTHEENYTTHDLELGAVYLHLAQMDRTLERLRLRDPLSSQKGECSS